MLPVACGKRISNTRESFWKYREIPSQYQDFPLPKSNFPHTKSDFPHTKSNFPQSAFCFLQRLSAFFNGFPLSSMAFHFSSTAFCFPTPAHSANHNQICKLESRHPFVELSLAHSSAHFYAANTITVIAGRQYPCFVLLSTINNVPSLLKLSTI